MSIEHSRIIKMVDHYGIPLRLAKSFAKHNDWKERAGSWQWSHDPTKQDVMKIHTRRHMAKIPTLMRPQGYKPKKQITGKVSHAKYTCLRNAGFKKPSIPLQKLVQLMWFGEEE